MHDIVQPDRLALMVCPNHKGGQTLIMSRGEMILKYHVTRMVWRINGEMHIYRYPLVQFVVAALEHYQATNPTQPLGMGEFKCAECNGFDNPGFNRLPIGEL